MTVFGRAERLELLQMAFVSVLVRGDRDSKVDESHMVPWCDTRTSVDEARHSSHGGSSRPLVLSACPAGCTVKHSTVSRGVPPRQQGYVRTLVPEQRGSPALVQVRGV